MRPSYLYNGKMPILVRRQLYIENPDLHYFTATGDIVYGPGASEVTPKNMGKPTSTQPQQSKTQRTANIVYNSSVVENTSKCNGSQTMKRGFGRHQIIFYHELMQTSVWSCPSVTGGFPTQRADDVELWYFLFCWPEQTVENNGVTGDLKYHASLKYDVTVKGRHATIIVHIVPRPGTSVGNPIFPYWQLKVHKHCLRFYAFYFDV